MKAAQINSYGGAAVVELNEVDVPALNDGQVLVEVHASSLNPFDTKLREGAMKGMISLQFPATLGGDIAGIVTEVGSDVTTFAVGDKVYGQANVVAGNSGAFAEFAATAAGQVGKLPENIDFEQAASLPLVGVSAWQALVQHIKLQPDQKLFIHGGAGGIGSIAVQIAKHLGAYVAVTATGDDIALVKKLGADAAVDYRQQNFAEQLRDFDAVFDTVGGDDFNKSLAILKPGGMAVSMTMQPNESAASERGVTAMMQSTRVTTAALDALRQLVEAGVVTPRVGEAFPLSQIQEAFTARESGVVSGKVVIKIK